jgi:hypothetical protein
MQLLRSLPRIARGGIFASIPVPMEKKSLFPELWTEQSPWGSALSDSNWHPYSNLTSMERLKKNAKINIVWTLNQTWLNLGSIRWQHNEPITGSYGTGRFGLIFKWKIPFSLPTFFVHHHNSTKQRLKSRVFTADINCAFQGHKTKSNQAWMGRNYDKFIQDMCLRRRH